MKISHLLCGAGGNIGTKLCAKAPPAGTPRDIVANTNEELVKMLKAPDSRERLLRLGGLPVGNTPEEFATYVKVEQEKWDKVVKAVKIQVDCSQTLATSPEHMSEGYRFMPTAPVMPIPLIPYPILKATPAPSAFGPAKNPP